MHLKDFGWNLFFESHFSDLGETTLVPARVVEELKGFHRVRAEQGEYLAEIAGRIRYRADDPDDFPAVGDWVGIAPRPEEGRARIECILPRRTKLSRKAAGRSLSEQILATNLDTVFVVSSLNREFNVRRYLARGETGAFVGSSGVGKSTIINALARVESLRVQPVREADDRGRHTTTSRQMFFLPGGSIVIDTPGLRELQLWESEEGMAQAFEDIGTFAERCKFRDCTHRGELGCAVDAAIQKGQLQRERLENQRKLQAELRFQERKIDPQVARQDKEKWKKIHRAMRQKPPRF